MTSQPHPIDRAGSIVRAFIAVSVLAFGAATLSNAPAGSVAGFGDVAADAFYTEAVQWMVDEEITTGTSATCFSPGATVSRGQTAAFLHRMEGEPQPAGSHPFTDVTADYQQAPVAWMLEAGVTTGTSATTYSPDAPLTRGEIAAMLWRLAGEPTNVPPHPFTDVVAEWQQTAVAWMSHRGITTGTSATTFSPDLEATRGELATFLHRYRGEPAVVVDPTHPTNSGCLEDVALPGSGGAEPPPDPNPGQSSASSAPERTTFDQVCDYMGTLADDPIVFPGEPGASHLHDFFGVLADADTTFADLRASESSCQSAPDNLSSYWTPTAFDNLGQQITPTRFSGYYRGKETDQEIYPTGLRVITDEAYFVEPLTGVAQLFVGFPDCSNGEVDSADHRSHMAYSIDGECPPSHPISVPRITFRVTYPAQPAFFSSGGLETAHADYFSGWTDESLAEKVERCLNEGRSASTANMAFCT